MSEKIENKKDKIVILFTIGCPQCLVLEYKLNKLGIQYEKNSDVNLMLSKGFTTTPMLEVDGECYNFTQALKLIQKGKI